MKKNKKINCKLESDEQYEKLHESLLEDLETVRKAKHIFGDDCFIAEAEENIKILKSLSNLFKFNWTVEDFNNALQELFDTMQSDKMVKRAVFYITQEMNS